MKPQADLSDDIKTLKEAALYKGVKVTNKDLWEFLTAAIGIRSHFKGHLVNFLGGESSQEVFDRKLYELFGLTFGQPKLKGPKPKKDKAK
jgi:hypothetical protein